MGDPDFRPHPYRITQEDIFLVYAAFQRSIHHLSILQDAPEYQKRKFHSDYKSIFKYVKHFCQDKRIVLNAQDSYYYSVFEYVLWNLESLFVKKQDLKDVKYLEKYDNWEQEFNRHVEKFPTLSNVSNAHVHAQDAHYVTDLISELPDEEGRLQFDKSRIIYSFDECTDWMSSPLKEALMSIPPTERLRWCVRLLVAYHYESECSMFMSTAFKLCLKAINLSPIKDSKSAEALCQTISWYLDFFKNCLTEAFPYRSKFIDRCTDYMFYLPYSNFHVFLEYGASYGYLYERLSALKFWMTLDIRRMGRIFSNETTNQKCLYYCLQAFYLYFRYCGFNRRYDLLRLIWASIPDPFLTEEDIHTCFSHMANNGVSEWWWSQSNFLTFSGWAKEIYLWYSQIIGTGENNAKSPRCLQHLSRCTIRQNIRFPMNVNSLNLPQRLKDYLMLKESIQQREL